MSGGGHRRTSKWDSEEVSRHFPKDRFASGSERSSNRESQPRWKSREGNYRVARDCLDDTMEWDGGSTMSPGLDDWRQQKRKYSFESSRGRSHRSRSRSKSKSPGYRSERSGLNDRVGRVASFDHRNHEPCRSGTIPCKFFASGNCRNGKTCRFSHDDQTRDSYNKYEPNDYRQDVDGRANMAPPREGSKWSGFASDPNLPKRHGDRNEVFGEQRAMRSSVDDSAPRDNRFMAHQIDIDEATKSNRSDDFRLTTHSSSGMGASKSKGTAIHGVDIERSSNHTEDQVPTPIRTFGKPDVLDTVTSEATSSNQCLMSTEQFSDLTRSLAQLLEDGKQLPELYAALNASNALGFMQSSAADHDGVPALSSSQYDPVNDSMELIKSVISEEPDEIALPSYEQPDEIALPSHEQPDEIALPSQLPLTGEPSGDGPHGTRSKDVEPNDNSHLSSEKHQFDDCKNEEHGMVKAEEKKEVQDGSKLSDSEGDDKADEKKKNSDGKSLRAFKFSLAEFVKELLKPTWKAGQINKEAHKTIVKKVVDKVTSTVQGSHIPQTQEKIDSYLSAYKPKLSKLVQAYADKVQKENPKVA